MRNITLVGALLLVGCGSPQTSSSWQSAAKTEDEENGRQPNLVVAPDGGDLSCPSPTACFHVTSDKNITHIFVDVAPDTTCEGETPAIDVTVDGVSVDAAKFHFNGGPCNHGEELVPRILWFPLTGNQKEAEVCVTTSGVAVDALRVGAKSAEECLYSTQNPACECPTPSPSPSPSCPPSDP